MHLVLYKPEMSTIFIPHFIDEETKALESFIFPKSHS